MAAREAFADTSALYAAVDARDTHHPDAAALMREMARSSRTIVTSDYVIAETVNLAIARRGRVVAERLLELFERSAGIRIEWIEANRFATTKAYFRKHAAHGYSFTDCSSFVVMRELGISDALTTDRHFVAAGFRSLLVASH